MSVTETQVANTEIRVNGDLLTKEVENMVELRLEQNLMLPDAFLLRIADPLLKLMDGKTFEIGKSLEFSYAGANDRRPKPIFKGEITSLEPEFTQEGFMLTIRGYDRSHRLNRARKIATYQNMSASQIASKIANAAGLAPRVDETGVTNEFTQQNNETDWEFLWRLASMYDYEVVVEDKTLHFRAAGGGSNAETVEFDWAKSRPQLISLRPRVTGVQQVKEVVVRGWDLTQKKKIEAKAQVTPPPAVKIGVHRSKVTQALGGGTLTVADAPITTMGQASKLAKSVASQLSHGFVHADGTSEGDARIVPGTKLKVRGIGRTYSGTYVVSKATHHFAGGGGYFTKFVVSGRAPRSLLDLLGGANRSSGGWDATLAVGVVTNNDDPDKLGRVRVKYPTLDESVEGWWARIVAIGSGKDRGQLMMPLVGDEVLVGFEGGDTNRPFVIGSVWNGKDTPGELVHTDGSYHLKTDKQILMNAKEDVTIKTDKNMTVEIKGDSSEKVDKKLTVKVGASEDVNVTQAFTLEAGTELLLKCGQASIKLTKMGQIEIKGGMVQMQGSGPVTIKGATVAIN
jgi:phage protein D